MSRRGIYTAGMTEILASRAVYGTAQIRQLERHALEVLQLPVDALMKRAAQAAWQRLRSEWPLARSLLVCCGPGNNGGDGCLLAALAKAADWQVDVIALAPLTASHPGFEALQKAGVQVQVHVPGQPLPQADLQVDAIFGIGLNRAPEGLAADLIQALNAGTVPVLALDCPSGLNADTGAAPGAVVRADATITFLAGKSGLVTGQARDWAGRLIIEPLGLEEAVTALSPVATALPWPQLPPRPRAMHKGRNGHLLVVGGEHGTGGAVHLTAMAALRSGAGLVSVATRSEQVLAFNTRCPEVMALGVNGPPALESMLEKVTGLAVGPGLGQGAWGHALWLTALDSGKPMVLDADGLNMLAQESHALPGQLVLTPHPGEAARLLHTTVPDIEADRYAAVRALAQRYRAVVVLKGAGSLIGDPDGRIVYCPWGNPGMAVGGMGDTLTGIIGALLVQGHHPWEAAGLGVALHALAGDRAARAGERGLLPTDLLPELRALVNGQAHA
ncbi:yjeF-like protein, hydroxyethylthiazole kinase-related protein [Frateuria aurantia DSM 6220]|uniref:Bifunctional NAD(P)H-hydrate repair enzyme n=2 Tax=Frateuria aurantia TaxID=81475 RepID=H8L0U1_FRAAD|nr:yjeF-like protein, hydroxyethylthiazole kinase-related protein [Frateuria aurantia DSM 6220]